MITRDEVLMGRDKDAPLNATQEANLQKLLLALNKFRAYYGKPMKVTSGYRPAAINKAAGGAKRSNHMVLLACDFADPDGTLDQYCLDNQLILATCNLYLEHPESTPGWCHLQCVAPKSGNTVFKP